VVRVWLQPTAAPDIFELHASARSGGQTRSTAATFHRAAKSDGLLYASTEATAGVPLISQYSASSGTWTRLPCPPIMYWPDAVTPQALPRLQDYPGRLRADQQGNLYLLAASQQADDLENTNILLYDRALNVWKLAPRLPEVYYDDSGAPHAGTDRAVSAVAGDGNVLYAVSYHDNSGLPIIDPVTGAPQIDPVTGLPVIPPPHPSSTLYRLTNPLAASWTFSPGGMIPGNGATWEVIGHVPTVGYCLRATLNESGSVFLSGVLSRTATTTEFVRYDPGSPPRWVQYPNPPSKLYARKNNGKLALVEDAELGNTTNPVGNVVETYDGAAEVDGAGSLYWLYLPDESPRANGQALPTLYRFDPTRLNGAYQDGIWKQIAIPFDWGYDSRGQLIRSRQHPTDLTVCSDGQVYMVGTQYDGLPAVLQYGTHSGTEIPGAPRIPVIPGFDVSYDATQAGYTRFVPSAIYPNLVSSLASGAVRRPGEFDYRPTAVFHP
jgi:hypothetical protein